MGPESKEKQAASKKHDRAYLRWAIGIAVAVSIVIGIAATLTLSNTSKNPDITSFSSTPISDETGGANLIATIRANDYHALAFSPTDPNVVFFGHHSGVMRSDDGGRSWQDVLNRPNYDAMNLNSHPMQPAVIYLAGHNVFARSDDVGSTWQPIASNLPGLDLHAFTIDLEDPNHLYAFAVGYGLFESKDSGATWELTSDQVPQSTVALAVLPGQNSQTIILGSGGQKVLRSDDGGETWRPSGDFVALKFAYSPASKVLYAGSSKGVYRSDDGGMSWSKIALDMPIMAVAVSPTDSSRLLAVTNKGQVYQLKDSAVAIRP